MPADKCRPNRRQSGVDERSSAKDDGSASFSAWDSNAPEISAGVAVEAVSATVGPEGPPDAPALAPDGLGSADFPLSAGPRGTGSG